MSGNISPAAPTKGDGSQPDAIRRTTPSQPEATAGSPKWSAGIVAGFVIGGLLALTSLLFVGGAGTLFWADRTQRDSGYVTTGSHEFSSTGSAIATEVIDLGDPGVGWLYSPLLLDEVRIRVIPMGSDSELFVGIGPSGDVDGYLAEVGHTVISEFWDEKTKDVDGGPPASAPEEEGFWAVSDIGTGARTLQWDPANGSWTVVVMNADGHAGITISTDLGARMSSLPWIAFVLLAIGVVFAIGGALLLLGAIRRRTTQSEKG